MPISLVLADDHPIILDGLHSLFEREADIRILASCSGGEETLAALRRGRPDVAVLDLTMPGLSGLEVARRVRDEQLPTRVVLLTASMSNAQVIEAMQLGVKGIVLKEMAPQLLLSCVREVEAGRQWIEKNLAGQALAALLGRGGEQQRAVELLTPREIEVVRLVARGLRNKKIAHSLSIVEGTVKIHLNRIYEKLGVDNRVELANVARREGLA
jgi:DNA-binding NarL/FixJ family response regulator